MGQPEITNENEKVPVYEDGEKTSDPPRRKSSVVNPEILAGEIFDERFESTQRGLKSR
jgi:amino acid transporter